MEVSAYLDGGDGVLSVYLTFVQIVYLKHMQLTLQLYVNKAVKKKKVQSTPPEDPWTLFQPLGCSHLYEPTNSCMSQALSGLSTGRSMINIKAAEGKQQERLH